MSDSYGMLHWDKRDVRLRASSLTNRGGATTVKLEIVVDSPWALASLLDQIAEAKRAPAKQAAPSASSSRALPSKRGLPAAEPLLALPAPGDYHEQS